MNNSKTMDLTQGNIFKQLIVFTLPIILAQVLQNLYNSVDAIVVGNNVGTEALAAVTASTDISQLLVGFFTGLSAGAGVLFARYFGAKNYEKLHDSIHTALLMSIYIGVAMAAIGIISAPLLLKIVNCPDDVYGSALLYLRVYLIGILFTAIYNVGSGVLRAVGDSQHPLYYLAVSSVTNIVLDLLFVVVLKIGVMGVACATIISQLTSMVLLTRNMLTTKDCYRVTIADLKIDKQMALEVVELGVPAGIQSAMISISNLFVQRYMNSFGKLAMAGTGAAKKIDTFVSLIGTSFGQSITTFVSQNHGAGREDRAFKGIWACLAINAIALAVLIPPLYINAEWALGFFTSDPDAIEYGALMMRTMQKAYFILVLNQVFSGATRGFGKSQAVMVLSLIGMIVIRQIYLYFAMNADWNIVHVFTGYPVGWFFSALFVIIYYYFVIYRKYKHSSK